MSTQKLEEAIFQWLLKWPINLEDAPESLVGFAEKGRLRPIVGQLFAD
jgi:hypothetical protein